MKEGNYMKHPYYEMIHLVERLHRQFLDLLKIELERRGVQDINNIQSLILYNVGEDELTVGELTARGYYLGSNVSYNLKKLVEAGYLKQERSKHDRRSIRVSLTDKGRELCEVLDEVFTGHIDRITESGFSLEELPETMEALRRLERFWTSQLGFVSAPFSAPRVA
ncbi:MAG: MarR family winged helix-turn-helix transcriptional regulator [Alphaproteobacteria bacterium]